MSVDRLGVDLPTLRELFGGHDRCPANIVILSTERHGGSLVFDLQVGFKVKAGTDASALLCAAFEMHSTSYCQNGGGSESLAATDEPEVGHAGQAHTALGEASALSASNRVTEVVEQLDQMVTSFRAPRGVMFA